MGSPAFVEDLRGAKLQLTPTGDLRLIDGKFDQGQMHARLLDPIVLGDVEGLGNQDAVGVLAVNRGGSGTLMYLVAVANHNGQIDSSAPAYPGDRVVVRSLSISSKVVTVDMLVQGPGTSSCCPNQQTSRKFTLVSGTLAQVGNSNRTTTIPSVQGQGHPG